ncbi:magnesium transporter [Clostridium oryzae]|uniref:Magnesium transporter MgtE n=1 Tax=Clostridium oryzae TaxID=1450648 RepID=A0A1V4IJE6_9CLOT|nr:CBS domain-containing protein [Clostridium oryzae]OPJ60121.1 magnesium transporter MgtE [Clostridium oryzae]
MIRLNNIFLSSILRKKLYDEFEENIGRLWDIYVTTEEGYPRAIGYMVKKDGEIFNYEFKNIQFWQDEEGKVTIKVRGVKDIIPRTYSYLLSKHLLNKQIVDVNDKKVVRVNDLKIAEIAGELRVVAVDSGTLARARRFGIEKAVKAFYNTINRKPNDAIIMWDNVESIEMVNASLKISIPYKKLSKLHPADLADILEDMDTSYRKKVFESLDENLAADTLEEVEPKVQAEILENMSEEKAAEVLEAMPNDEIADILEDMDGEFAEKLLKHINKEDVEEIRELMEYEDETVGSIMNTDYLAFSADDSVGKVIECLREMNPDDEVIYYVYVIDNEGTLLGFISLKDLIINYEDTKLSDIMNSDIISIKVANKIDEAMSVAIKYNLITLPVTDENEVLVGIAIIYDILDDYVSDSKKKHYKKVV